VQTANINRNDGAFKNPTAHFNVLQALAKSSKHLDNCHIGSFIMSILELIAILSYFIVNFLGMPDFFPMERNLKG